MSVQDFKNVNTWKAFEEMTADLKYSQSEGRFIPSKKGATTVTLDQLYEKMNNLEVISPGDGVLAVKAISNITTKVPNKGRVREFFDKKIADINQTCSQIQQEEHKVKTAQKKLTTLLSKGTQIGFWLNQSNINKEYEALCKNIEKTSKQIQKIIQKPDKKEKDFKEIIRLNEEMIELKKDGYYCGLKAFVEEFEKIDKAYYYDANNEYNDAKHLYEKAKAKLKPLEGFKEDELDIHALRLNDQTNKASASCKIAFDSKEYQSFIKLKDESLGSNAKKLHSLASQAKSQIETALIAISKLPEDLQKELFSDRKSMLEKNKAVLGRWG